MEDGREEIGVEIGRRQQRNIIGGQPAFRNEEEYEQSGKCESIRTVFSVVVL